MYRNLCFSFGIGGLCDLVLVLNESKDKNAYRLSYNFYVYSFY